MNTYVRQQWGPGEMDSLRDHWNLTVSPSLSVHSMMAQKRREDAGADTYAPSPSTHRHNRPSAHPPHQPINQSEKKQRQSRKNWRGSGSWVIEDASGVGGGTTGSHWYRALSPGLGASGRGRRSSQSRTRGSEGSAEFRARQWYIDAPLALGRRGGVERPRAHSLTIVHRR